MDAKINIAKILKDKPQGTKLWTDMFGSVMLYVVTDACDAFQVKHHNKEPWFDKDGKLCKEGVLCIYPSKSMRDWHKFAWKKGDVLVSNDGKREVLFKTWVNDSYTKFVGLHCLIINDNEEVEYDNGTTVFNTNDFKGIDAEDAVQTYINTIEERFGGKINRETLKVEKSQPEFKDGDMVSLEIRYIDSEDVIVETYIVHGDYNYGEELNFHAGCNNLGMIKHNSCVKPTNTSVRKVFIRYATDSEKQQLFEALAKKGKAWDAEKKQIVDLKPKVELKPFDKVLVRNDKEDQWSANIFCYQVRDNMYYCLGECYWRYCIPYEGNEHLLGTTKDVEG